MHCGSLGSFRFFGFIRARPACLQAHLGASLVHFRSLASFWRPLDVVGFIQAHHACRWVHSGVAWVSSASFGLVGFIRARPGGCSVHSGAPSVTYGKFGRAWSPSGLLGFVRFFRGRPGCRRVHSGWLGSFGRSLKVIEFIRVCWVI